MTSIKERLKASRLRPHLEIAYGWWIDIVDSLSSTVGYIPSHNVRLFLYRHVFRMKIGKGSYIHFGCRFYQARSVSIGDHCVIGHCCFLDGRCGLTIKNNVSIAGETNIYTLQHDSQSPTFAGKGGPVVIEDYVFTGSRAMMLPNLTVGKGSGIAAGAVVTKDVDEYTIVGGIPARKIGERNRDLVYTLKCARLFH